MARVLVVEDDEVTRDIMVAHLRQAGHRVLAVASGHEALVTVDERGLADVAVLDIGLPDTDGFALMHDLRARPGGAGLPVIFLTARVSPEEIEQGRRAGAAYLTKPFVASALLGFIERALHAADPDDGGW